MRGNRQRIEEFVPNREFLLCSGIGIRSTTQEPEMSTRQVFSKQNIHGHTEDGPESQIRFDDTDRSFYAQKATPFQNPSLCSRLSTSAAFSTLPMETTFSLTTRAGILITPYSITFCISVIYATSTGNPIV